MIRIRLLSLLVLAFSVFCIAYGNLLLSVVANQWWKIAGFFLHWGGWIFVISSSAILILSIFCIEAGEDGSFTINSKSLYGRIFVGFLKSDEDYGKRVSGSSYCKVFWKTNLAVAGFALLLILFYGLLYKMYEAGLLASFLVLSGFALILLLICVSIELFDNFKSSAFAERLKENGAAVMAGNILFWLFILFLFGFFAMLIYATWDTLAVLRFLKIVFKILMYLLPSLAVVWFVLRISRPLSNTQFGQNFSYLYKNYLCPRIKLED